MAGYDIISDGGTFDIFCIILSKTKTAPTLIISAERRDRSRRWKSTHKIFGFNCLTSPAVFTLNNLYN